MYGQSDAKNRRTSSLAVESLPRYRPEPAKRLNDQPVYVPKKFQDPTRNF
jgi:hypothetical protein